MAGHSRLKDGVLSHAYVPAISLIEAPRAPKRDRRDEPGDDGSRPPRLKEIFQ
jgi:hypothetical protein